MHQISSRRIAPILGALGGLGLLSIDMYLPAMPKIAAHLNAGEGAVQMSLMAFFAGLTIGQLFYGPVSDRVGRKVMINVGLVLFILGSIGCATSATAGQLTAWRFAQGLGGSIGMVIGFAVVRDLFTGRQAAALMALMMIVQGVAPVIAPLIGTAVIAAAPWQAVFLVLALFGLICLVCVNVGLPETRMRELRAVSNPLAALHTYGHLLVSRRFVAYVAVLALAIGGFFAYIAGSSFAFISVHGLSPAAYSGIFALNSLGLMAGAQIGPRLMGRYRPETIVRTALLVYAASAVGLAVLELSGGANLFAFSALLFVVIAAMAFTLPLCSTMALEAYGAISGTASALMGALQFGSGTIASLAVGLLADGTTIPMVTIIAICGVTACVIAFAAFPEKGVAVGSQTVD